MNEHDHAEAMRQAAREALRELMPDLLEVLGNAPRDESPRSSAAPSADVTHAANDRRRPIGAETVNAVEPDVVPHVPAPPVAAVLRPSTWTGPAVAGEVIGDGEPTPAVARASPAGATEQPRALAPHLNPTPEDASPAAQLLDASVETVRLDTDEDLNAFVRKLTARLENPRDRLAIRAGRLRFALRRSGAAGVNGTGAGNAGGGGEAVRVAKGAVTERTVRDAAARGARLVLAREAVLTPLARDQARALSVEIEKETRC